MSAIELEAEARSDIGKGASRRLRRLEKVPAIVYGGDKAPESILLSHSKVVKALEEESFYSSIFNLRRGNKVEHVILKALQRHPYKSLILHMDLQRVSPKDVLVKNIPIHFINEEKAAKVGGIITHTMTQVEVRCQAKDLPEYIEVDLANLGMDEVLHLSDLKLPKNVQLTVDLSDNSHNHPVVSIHASKTSVEEQESAAPAADESEEASE